MAYELGTATFALTDMILCEVLKGIRCDQILFEVQLAFSRFIIFDIGGRDLAIGAAQNYRYLPQRGHTGRKTIDCYIATFCISE